MRHLWLFLTLPAALALQQGDPHTVTRPTAVRTAPDAALIGQLQSGTVVEVLARDRGWVRVRLEGWVRESDVITADTALRRSLSAADLRVDPEGARGKIVQWRVEFLALQAADPFRRGMAEDEPYLLARGPGAENAILYLVVPPSLIGTARALRPLTHLAVTARVRDGRSEPAGVPILDLQSVRPVK